MADNRVKLTTRHDLTPDEIEALEELIYELNASRTGHRDALQLGFVLSLDDKMVGAVAGFTWGGICELRQLWIDEPFRRAGHGRALLSKAIDEARARGCAYVYLATYSFQAPDFYKKFGFQPLAVIKNKPLGHSDIIMQLALTKCSSAD